MSSSAPDAQKYTTKLHSKRILIIGGTSGIGHCVAEACLEQGATVILSSSQPSRIESAIARLLKPYPSATNRLSGHACDLASPASAEENIEHLFAAVGQDSAGRKLDHVISTAGDALATVPVATATLAQMQAAGMVRFFGPLLIARFAPPWMNPGPAASITLCTGSVAERPMPDWSIVASYAAGLYGMVRGLALDLKPLRVNLISPGAVKTELWDKMPREAYRESERSMGERSLTGRIGRPEDVAEAFVYAMRDENATGTVVGTNGGGLLV